MQSSLGTILKQAREKRGFTLQDLARVTKIPESTLIMLETDRYDQLPVPIYVRGFLKNCAQILELDSQELIGVYQNNCNTEFKQELLLKGEKVKSPGINGIIAFIKRIDPKLWVGLSFAVVVIFFALAFFSRNSNQEFAPQVLEPEIQQVNSPASLIIPKNVQSIRQQSGSLSLSGKAIDDVWLRIHSDEKLVFEGILKKGQRETWLASDFFKVRVGNPKAIKFEMNDSNVGLLGPAGKVIEVRITKDGKWISDAAQ